MERIIVIDVSENKDALHVFVNPELLWASERRRCARRAVFPVPASTTWCAGRPACGCRAMNPARQAVRARLRGHTAMCVQHEMDHLEVESSSSTCRRLKQTRIRTRLRKRHARQA